MKNPVSIDRPSLRRQFDRRAQRLDQADFLLREVERRLFERLEYIKLAPQTVLDVGCGQGKGAVQLAQRFAQAQVFGLDQSPSMIMASQKRHLQPSNTATSLPWKNRLADLLPQSMAGMFGVNTPPSEQKWQDRLQFMVADTHQLPFADRSVDLVWSNLAAHWFADPRQALAQWRRVLRPDGLAMFTALGVDTLRELLPLGVQLPTFQDMHDFGDALQNLRFAEPVMDMEVITLTYQAPDAVLRDVQAIGGNALTQRFRGLRSRSWRVDLLAQIERANIHSLTFEIVYGHAWAPKTERLSQGISPIEFVPRRK
jgi:malonyl-CoA O-methyltransferase